MKIAKKILNWLLFLSVITGFFLTGGVYRHYSLKNSTIRNTKYLLSQDNADVILVGNSHMFNAASPAMINAVLPSLHTTSFAHYPASMIEYYPYFRLLTEQEHPPKMIVLDAHTMLTDDSALLYSIHPETYWQLLPEILIEVPPENHLRWFFPLLGDHIFWKDAESVAWFFQNLLDTQLDEERLQQTSHPAGKFLINRTVMSDEKFTAAEGAGVKPMQAQSKWLLAEYAGLCNANGVQLILVNFPSATQWGAAHTEVAAAASELGIPFYDFNQELARDAEYGNVIYVAFDTPIENLNSHVNTMGAIVSSLALAEHISAELGTPVDVNTFSQYQEVVLTDIDLLCLKDDQTCTASITPLVDTEAVLYDWRVMGRENEKSFVIERELSSRELSFTFSANSWEQANYLSLRIIHPVLEKMEGQIELRLFP